jgi:hypothetical protein
MELDIKNPQKQGEDNRDPVNASIVIPFRNGWTVLFCL